MDYFHHLNKDSLNKSFYYLMISQLKIKLAIKMVRCFEIDFYRLNLLPRHSKFQDLYFNIRHPIFLLWIDYQIAMFLIWSHYQKMIHLPRIMIIYSLNSLFTFGIPKFS